MIRVVIADDHTIVRTGLARLLADEPDICIAGEAASCGEVGRVLAQTPCDVLVLDLDMPARGGDEVLLDVVRRYPGLPVVIFSLHREPQFAVRALGHGAAAYIPLDAGVAELLEAVRLAPAGRRYVASTLIEPLADYLASGMRLPHDRLSAREASVLSRLAAGETVTAIATAMMLSVKTVSTYRTRLLRKLHVPTTAALVRYALENRLVH